MPKLLVAITSCHLNATERQVIRDTWLKGQAVDYKFFIGLPRRRGKKDEVFLNAPDTYTALPLKVYRMVEWFLKTDYSHMFKCDDDTWVHISRLLASGWQREDYRGLRCAFFYAGGGPGYLLSRQSAQILMKVPYSEWEKQQQEDQAVGLFLQNKMPIQHDPRFRHGFREPAPDNDFITAHKCDLQRMYALQKQFA